ncbi:DUF4406 domain-containing protein [Melaminivora sp.]|uniref:DUF4406 domain-containing protein n=1 Tax=Melaminivora sp. TaxID=1933032 RepID=UPI0028AE354F|nr:DUF4406 domain-containing protein [Melaminivora sp.]
MRVYIAGPMTGLPESNYPAFHAAAAHLRARGFNVENPAENGLPACGGTWLGWMRLAVAQLARCDAIYLLPGWKESRGAQVEHQLARGLGLWVMYPPRAAQPRAEPLQAATAEVAA